MDLSWKRREDLETGDEKSVPWEDVKKELEDEGTIDEEAYSKQERKKGSKRKRSTTKTLLHTDA